MYLLLGSSDEIDDETRQAYHQKKKRKEKKRKSKKAMEWFVLYICEYKITDCIYIYYEEVFVGTDRIDYQQLLSLSLQLET